MTKRTLFTLILMVQLVKSQLQPPPDPLSEKSAQVEVEALVEALLRDPGRLELLRDEIDPRLNPLLDARLANVRLARPSYDPYVRPRGRLATLGALGALGHHESSVHRNPYESHSAYDAIRTQDADLAPYNPYTNPYLAPHLLDPRLRHLNLPVSSAAALRAAGDKHHVKGHHLTDYYIYDVAKIPECAYTNKHYYNLTFCLQDDYYPTETILQELDRNRPLVDRLLSDITYQSADNLVDGMTKIEEEGYTYEHYYGNKKYQTFGQDYNGYRYAHEYYKKGGYLCPSDIYYGRPKRAINTYGKWKVIVNLPDEYYAKGYGKGYEKYTQTQRLEQCMYPSAPCSFVDKKYYSECLQKHNFVRLLSYTYEEGLHIDSFKMPIACSCHISEPHHYAPGYNGRPITPANNPKLLLDLPPGIPPHPFDGAKQKK